MSKPRPVSRPVAPRPTATAPIPAGAPKVYTEADAKAQLEGAPNRVELCPEAALLLLTRALRQRHVSVAGPQTLPEEDGGAIWHVYEKGDTSIQLVREEGATRRATDMPLLRDLANDIAAYEGRIGRLERVPVEERPEDWQMQRDREQVGLDAKLEHKARVEARQPEVTEHVFPPALKGAKVVIVWDSEPAE